MLGSVRQGPFCLGSGGLCLFWGFLRQRATRSVHSARGSRFVFLFQDSDTNASKKLSLNPLISMSEIIFLIGSIAKKQWHCSGPAGP